MTEISIYRKRGFITGIGAKGHSGSGRRGNDIVCAAVSSLMQALEVGLETVVGLKSLNTDIDAAKAIRHISWDESDAEQAGVLARTIKLSLEGVAKAYPENVSVLEVDADEHHG